MAEDKPRTYTSSMLVIIVATGNFTQKKPEALLPKEETRVYG